MPITRRCSSKTTRAGLTLIEVLVAILILTAGALSTIGTQVAVARLSAGTVAQQLNAAAAAAILDSLRAEPCALLAPGNSTTRNARISWSANRAGDLATLRINVLPSQGAPWSAETLVPCA